MNPSPAAPMPEPAVPPSLRDEEFPLLRDAVYLNAAAVTPLPERTRREVDAHNLLRGRIHHFTDADFVAPLGRARDAAARLVGADPEEIALGWNTSFGLNLAAQALPVDAGATVVVSDREFPANVYPWMAMRDARLEIVPARPDGRPDEARLLERLERGDVAVFALSSVQFTNGYRADLARFGEACRRHGTFFVVDAIQHLGQLPLDVRACGIDVLATGGHKWLLSPFGTGFSYVRRDLLSRMEPTTVGWTALTASSDLASLLDYRWELRPDARRFEVSTLPVQDVAGMAASLELLLEVGVGRIERHLQELLRPLADWLRGRDDVELLSDPDPARRSAILAFRTRDPAASFAALAGAGVVCSLREGAIRVAPHLYNTRADVERVVEVLEQEEG